jgi:hypothetical protein
MVFWHVLPVPSCIAVCLSGGVLAWDGLKTKRGFVGRETGLGALLPALLANCARSVPWTFLSHDGRNVVDVLAHLIFGLHLMINQASWRSAWTWTSLHLFVGLDQF